MNRKLPEYLLGKYQLIGTVTFSVLFAVVYLNMSIPFSDTAWFGLGDSVMFLYTLLFIIVSLIILITSRIFMYTSKKLFEMTYVEYTLWCLAEIIMICALYTWITTDWAAPHSEVALKVFGRAMNNGLVALGVPYIIAGMYFAIIDKNNTIRLMNYENVVTDEPARPEALHKVTLFDNNGSLKMSVNPDSLYYIESDDNYIKVWYTDNKGTLQPYILRCRLKTVEASFKGSGLIRCNRKYIVNLNKVVTLRKENDGYILVLDNVSIPPIPVTKTYTDAVLSHFTETSPLLEPMEE